MNFLCSDKCREAEDLLQSPLFVFLEAGAYKRQKEEIVMCQQEFDILQAEPAPFPLQREEHVYTIRRACCHKWRFL